MKISHLTIRNILGISDLELSPGGFTEISGQNGTGKTSVLEAIKSTLNGGHDATLLRKGADKGEVVLVLDDGTELSKTVTASGSTTNVRRDGKKQARPGEVIKALTDALSVNPVDFLLAPKKERVRVLLEAMPLEADVKHLAELTGLEVKPAPGLHALHVIQQVHAQVYDARTGTNRAVKEKAATINQLEAAVPPLPAGAEGSEEELLLAQINAAQAARDLTLGKIQNKIEGIRIDIAEGITNLRSAAQQKIDDIKAELARDVEAQQAFQREQEQKAEAAREAAKSKCTATTAPLSQQLAVIRNDREAAGRRKQTLDTIETMRTELAMLQTEAANQTAALEAIEEYKAQLLAALPIPGLEVIDGEVYRDGVPFDRLNTAQQVGIAVEVAKLRAADLGVVCVDRIECLDTATLEEFRASALESGLQLFVTRVSDDDFSINTQD